jgi:regulator of replication initiation timing
LRQPEERQDYLKQSAQSWSGTFAEAVSRLTTENMALRAENERLRAGLQAILNCRGSSYGTTAQDIARKVLST